MEDRAEIVERRKSNGVINNTGHAITAYDQDQSWNLKSGEHRKAKVR